MDRPREKGQHDGGERKRERERESQFFFWLLIDAKVFLLCFVTGERRME